MTRRTPPARLRKPARPGLVVTSVVLLSAGIVSSACNSLPSYDDQDGAGPSSVASPTDATVQEFCGAYGLVRGVDADADAGDLAVRLRTHAVSLSGVGTPDDAPVAAREGFVVYVDATGGATPDEAESVVDATSAAELATALRVAPDDTEALGAFQDYVAGTCFTTGS